MVQRKKANRRGRASGLSSPACPVVWSQRPSAPCPASQEEIDEVVECTLSAVRPIQMTLDLRADRIRRLLNTAGGCIIEAGLELIKEKAEHEHGVWLPWLEHEFNWKARTAQNLMQIAEAFSRR